MICYTKKNFPAAKFFHEQPMFSSIVRVMLFMQQIREKKFVVELAEFSSSLHLAKDSAFFSLTIGSNRKNRARIMLDTASLYPFPAL